MDRRRIQLEGSLPWNPDLLFEAMEELFPKIEYKSEEEHVEIIIENKIMGGPAWFKYRKDNNLAERGYMQSPWLSFGKTNKVWFSEIFGEKKTEQEHRQIMKENNLTSGPKWFKYYKKKNLKEQGYFVAPWQSFNKIYSEWFAYVFGEKKTKKEYQKIMKDNDLAGLTSWYRYYKDNNLKEQGYFIMPWLSFDKTCKEWFVDIFGAKKTYTKKQYTKIMKDNNLINSVKWLKYYKAHNLAEQNYTYSPWQTFGIDLADWFAEIFGAKKTYTKKQYVKIMKDNNIISSPKWFKYYEDNNLEEQNYILTPWLSFDKTCKEWFVDIFGAKKTYTKKQYTKIMKDNNLHSSLEWVQYRIDNNLAEQGYKHSPWQTFGMAESKWFAEIFGERTYKSKQEHQKIMVDNNLTGSGKWLKYHKKHNLAEQGYMVIPWRSFGIDLANWFVEIFGAKKTKKEYIEVMVNNNLTNSPKWFKYRKDNNLIKQNYYQLPWASFGMKASKWFTEIRKQINNV